MGWKGLGAELGPRVSIGARLALGHGVLALLSTLLRSCPLHLLRGGGLCHLSLVLSGPGRSLVPSWILGWCGVPACW